MITREEVRVIRKFLNTTIPNVPVVMDAYLLNAIDSMCADYEFQYSRSY